MIIAMIIQILGTQGTWIIHVPCVSRIWVAFLKRKKIIFHYFINKSYLVVQMLQKKEEVQSHPWPEIRK